MEGYANFYNFDETGFSISTFGRSDVIIEACDKQAFREQSGRQEWATLSECICSDGTVLDPLCILAGKSVRYDNSLNQKNWTFTSQPNGWTSNEICIDFIRSFDRQTRAKAQGKIRYLICDGHGSHVTAEFLLYCRRGQIEILLLPAHSSHLTQPLDVAIFRPLKRYFAHEAAHFSLFGNGRWTKSDFVQVYSQSR